MVNFTAFLWSMKVIAVISMIFSTLLMRDIYRKLLRNNNTTTNNAANSIVKVNIFYDSMSYELSTESPKMDIVSVLASIGGNLGLFLGVSVFSLCELIEVAIEIYFVKRAKNFSF